MLECNKRRGFTLIEVIVVAAIIAILAGILVPMIFNQIDESKKARATGDCKVIQTAIMTFRKDTGTWPDKSDPATANVSMLFGTGANLADADYIAQGFDPAVRQNIVDHLKADTNTAYGALWKGPYLTEAGADPWGNAYIINTKDFDAVPAKQVWIISTGPEGSWIHQPPLIRLLTMTSEFA